MAENQGKTIGCVSRENIQCFEMAEGEQSLYKDVQIALENLEMFPEDDVLPYHIEQVQSDDAQEALTSRYDNVMESNVVYLGQTHFEGVVIADVDAHTPVKELTAAAIQHVKSKGKPFIQVVHGAEPVGEFSNVNLFPMIYPLLFPMGVEGSRIMNGQR